MTRSGDKRTGRRPGDAAVFAAIEALQRLAEVFGRRRQQLAKEAGLTDAQWRVLQEIDREEFMPSLFARSRDTAPAAVSRTLRQLQDAGLVEARIGREDGRQREYRLTAAGAKKLAALATSRAAAIDAVWRGLPAAELRRFADLAGSLSDRLEAYASRVEARKRG